MALAKKFPRDEFVAEQAIIRSCKNYSFAEKALYKKPVGKKQVDGQWVQNYIEGPSIRLAEEVLRHWGNVKTQKFVIFESPQKRIVRIICTDLQSNNSYSSDLIIDKTVERKKAAGREVVGERTNTYNERVFIVLATEDEIQNKENAMASKAIRNSGLRLIPAHIVEGATEEAKAVLARGVQSHDPAEVLAKMVKSFESVGVSFDELLKYLGHPLDKTTSEEILDLKGIFNSIKDGEAKWSDYANPQQGEQQVEITDDEDWDSLEQKIEAGDPETHTEVSEPAKKRTKKK